ncbi:MAG: iron-containing redox enzyme family protein [Candidatus Dormibacteria bacterium]
MRWYPRRGDQLWEDRSMSPDDLRQSIEAALVGRRLLSHPFYQRWEAGLLQPGELAAYAAQYRHFEAALPGLLRNMLAGLDPSSSAARLVAQNLADEEGNPRAHVTLFAAFADGVGAEETAPTGATRHLLDTYARQVAAGSASGLAALIAYELQAPEIAATKAAGLSAHYALDSRATEFWDVHAHMDRDHAVWAVDALAQLEQAEAAISAARAAADAWWAFLDERESAAALVTA